MKLINKDKVVAKIKRLQDATMDENANFYSAKAEAEFCILSDLENFIDTLEDKDIDLEKEINDYISNNFFGSQTLGFFANRTKEEPNDQDIALCAKHFFELGLKAKKGE